MAYVMAIADQRSGRFAQTSVSGGSAALLPADFSNTAFLRSFAHIVNGRAAGLSMQRAQFKMRYPK